MTDGQPTKDWALAEADVGEKGIVLRTASDVRSMAMLVVGSDLCPKQYRNKPKDATIAILAGQAVGFAPMQSLQNIAVINGRPSMYGDGPTALAYGNRQVEWIKEWFELDGDTIEPNYPALKDYPDGLTACWQTQRKDTSEPSPVTRFSVTDAKVANLWGKTGPWTQYPRRMLIMRARSWGLRDNYADALQGISQAEEWADMAKPHEKHELSDQVGAPVIEHTVVEPEQEGNAPAKPADQEPQPDEGLPGAPPCEKCGKKLDHTGENPLCLTCQASQPKGELFTDGQNDG